MHTINPAAKVLTTRHWTSPDSRCVATADVAQRPIWHNNRSDEPADPTNPPINRPMNKILIADDNEANRELIEAYLINIDCDLETAVDGQDTLDKVASFEPDLILLDVMMPKLSGFEVCKQIKENIATSHIMILMVTALNELGDIERAVGAGTDDFLSKPVNKIELTKRVENMLKLKGTTDELERLRRYIAEMEK